MAETLAPTPTYVAPVYEESSLVQSLHEYPHISGSDEFEVSSDYVYAVRYMFFATIVGGMVFIVGQWLSFCFEAWCKCCYRTCCRCCRPRCFKAFLAIAFLWLLLGTGLSYWGRNAFQQGADKVYDISQSVAAIFELLETYSAQMVDDSDTVETSTADLTCPVANVTEDFTAAATELSVATEEVFDSLDGLSGSAERIGRLFDKKIPRYIDYGIGAITILMAATVFSGLVSVVCGSVAARKTLLAVASLVLVVFCPIIAFELTLSVAVSDFCVGLDDQDSSFIDVADRYAPEDSLELVTFYASCNGTNPLDADLNASLTSVASLQQAVAEGYTAGCSAAELSDINSALTSLNKTIFLMYDSIGCPTVNPLLSDLLYDVVCKDVVRGLYRLWVVQLACAVSLWTLLFFVQSQVHVDEHVDAKVLKQQEINLGLHPDADGRVIEVQAEAVRDSTVAGRDNPMLRPSSLGLSDAVPFDMINVQDLPVVEFPQGGAPTAPPTYPPTPPRSSWAAANAAREDQEVAMAIQASLEQAGMGFGTPVPLSMATTPRASVMSAATEPIGPGVDV
mmetsp:Transcript_23169/g.67566  ORF Transcript_23169/g.67566 Transcript_23169/m.67566 type:complete len:565 (-) Transcript_23169:27-1721(-)